MNRLGPGHYRCPGCGLKTKLEGFVSSLICSKCQKALEFVEPLPPRKPAQASKAPSPVSLGFKRGRYGDS